MSTPKTCPTYGDHINQAPPPFLSARVWPAEALDAGNQSEAGKLFQEALDIQEIFAAKGVKIDKNVLQEIAEANKRALPSGLARSTRERFAKAAKVLSGKEDTELDDLLDSI